MKESGGLALKVGIFVVIGIVILIGFSLRATDELGNDQYELQAYFEDVAGLNEGSGVSLAGVRIGRINELAFDTERRAVKATLAVSDNYEFPTDSVAKIRQEALLGTSLVTIEYGSASDMIPRGGELETRETPGLEDLLASVSEVSEKADELIAGFQDSQGSLFGKIESVIDENRDDIRRTTESMAEAGPKLDALASSLTEITDNLRGGQGTLGRLYTDEDLYNELKGFSTDARQIASDLRDGDGTLSRLIYEDDLVRTAQESFTKLGEAGEQVQSILGDNEEGIREAIASLSELGPEIEGALENFFEVGRKINEGEGTLGRLVNDPALYEDTQRAVNQVGESFETTEEQGVIRSFIGVVFGALI